MSRRTGRRHTVFVVAVGLIVGTLGLGVASAQVDVRTIEVSDVASCEQLAGQVGSAGAWAGIRIASPRDGAFGNSYATVNVSRFSGNQFDWSADLGMNAVLITYQDSKESPSKQQAYLYSPGASNGTAVGNAEVSVGGTITQITFCHDPSTPTAGLSTDTTLAPTTTASTTAPTTTAPSQSTTTTMVPSSSTAADSTTTLAPTTTEDLTTTTHLDEVNDELAVTGADSGVLVMIGLVLVMLGAGFTSLLELGRRSSYTRTGSWRR